MKTWQEFNDTVNDLLLVDGLRKGRGVEKFRDRMVVAGVRDLMAYIPELRTTPMEESFSKDELELHGEKQCMIDRGQFYTAPVLGDNETLSILYNQEYVYKPLFEATAEQKSYKTNLGDDAALAVHYFVKYHFMKDVNDDASQAQTNLQNYQRERRKIAVNKPEVLSTQNPVESLDQGGGFLLGG
jgi:hypothetical protein